MEKTKRIWALLLMLALCLMGCGAQNTGEAAVAGVGKYTCVRAVALGRELEPEELYPGGVQIELRSDGKGLIQLDGQEGRLQWSLEGETLSLTTGSGVSAGTLRDGVMVIDMLGSGTVLTFTVEGVEPVQENEEALQWWLGGWYGWWAVREASGGYSNLRGHWFDCCAEISYVDSAAVQIRLWDEEGALSEPMAQAKLSISGDIGAAENIDGVFMGAELQPGDWATDPEETAYEDMLRITGRYEDEKGGFDYEIILRPWGLDWEDVKTAEPELVPYYYEDWYLPLIDGGQAMPERMELADQPS